ncbi:cupin domain-containing protein [Paludibacter sp.]|jgi:quercetin dioxygenase-like cupin family protein|uniref:cupin domain-containing protein n=1 Tax=Paludibacter sp. TaxID=1898105 RepID=UPI001352B102|nr:cupin domain-containing protein [Paludibacter sp.]MTK52551.1 cupin domain-containing protein [Paludibacter sp.]
MNTPFEKAVVFPLENSVEYTAGGVVSKQIIKSAAGNVTLFSFDKGQGLTEHTAPFDAIVQVLDGEVEISIDGNPHRVKKGECIIMPANHPHALTAVEAFKMLLTMIKG